MEKIQDSGKVWCKGYKNPFHAVRAENKVFATGKEEAQAINCWIENDLLCIDLHEPDREIRTARKIPLNLEPTLDGTLFDGFNRTKHADVKIVSSHHERIKEKMISGENYKAGKFDRVDSREFWNKVWQ
tara:strand:+ start:371 stop:757 length:387 start_codon:yes stop_codon:yes gene_type:complete